MLYLYSMSQFTEEFELSYFQFGLGIARALPKDHLVTGYVNLGMLLYSYVIVFVYI